MWLYFGSVTVPSVRRNPPKGPRPYIVLFNTAVATNFDAAVVSGRSDAILVIGGGLLSATYDLPKWNEMVSFPRILFLFPFFS